jgi:hypothetical protein
MKTFHAFKAILIILLGSLLFASPVRSQEKSSGHLFNGDYTGKNLDRVAFPIGGIGAGMFCMEGSGDIFRSITSLTCTMPHWPLQPSV